MGKNLRLQLSCQKAHRIVLVFSAALCALCVSALDVGVKLRHHFRSRATVRFPNPAPRFCQRQDKKANTREETPMQPQLTLERQRQIIMKVSWRLLPLIVLCYLINYIDRTNVSFA